MYRKHAYQIGGTAETPTLISGQLIAQLNINRPSRKRWRCLTFTLPCAWVATPRP